MGQELILTLEQTMRRNMTAGNAAERDWCTMTDMTPRATSRRKRYWALKHVGTNDIRPELWNTYREVRTGKGKSK